MYSSFFWSKLTEQTIFSSHTLNYINFLHLLFFNVSSTYFKRRKLTDLIIFHNIFSSAVFLCLRKLIVHCKWEGNSKFSLHVINQRVKSLEKWRTIVARNLHSRKFITIHIFAICISAWSQRTQRSCEIDGCSWCISYFFVTS